MPVLVLDGDLDMITPLGDSIRAAGLFPNSTLVTVRNVGHVTALADFDGCTSGIVRRFLRTLSPGDTSCASRTQEIHVAPKFPRRVARAPAGSRAARGDRSKGLDRRAAWAAAWAVGDALARYQLMSGVRGHGLRGGRFVDVGGSYYSYQPVRLPLRGVRFVSDLAVSGSVEWDRRAGRSLRGCGYRGRGPGGCGSAGGRARRTRWLRCGGGWAGGW
jgi:TAP-like protein